MENFKQETIHFFSGKGKKVIGRLESGKIAIISYGYTGKWVMDGDEWLCDIVKEEEHKVIVMPVKLVKSHEETEREVLERLSKLSANGFEKKFYHPKDSVFYTASK
jgi:hypothetical protein